MRKVLALLFGLFVGALPAQAQIINSLPYLLQNGTVADASQVMADFNQIVNNVNANAASGGANSSITSLSGLTSPPSGLGSLVYYGSSIGGTSNAITLALTLPTSFQLRAGSVLWFEPSSPNSGAATLNTTSSGVVAILKNAAGGLVPLTGGELQTTVPAWVLYDGTQYILMNPFDTDYLPYTPIASAATTNLGAAASQKLNVTGNTNITSFGASATVGAFYYLRFDGSLTLTYNMTSMILPGGVNIATTPGDTAVATYLGSGNWQVTSYVRALQMATGPYVHTLLAKSNSGAPNTKIDVTAVSALLTSSNGYGILALSPSFTINAAVTGANGMDAGGLVASSEFHIYMIFNGSTVAGLLSASATSPTLPTGYNYPVRIGAIRTDGSGNIRPFSQRGRKTNLVATGAPLAVASVAAGAWTAIAWNTLIPSTATEIALQGYAAAGYTTSASPNNTVSTSYPPFAAANGGFSMGSLVLEGSNLYYGLTNFGNLNCTGWTDSVPAD